MTVDEMVATIDGIFEEEALAVGGLTVLYDLDDDLVRSLVDSFDSIRQRALDRLQGEDLKQDTLKIPKPRPHPAIQQFLARLGSGSTQGGEL